ncbi:tetratricopeptide repeat protein [Archangium lansingense]|uniref:Tetratricopeptide repeat protein n=1 Tax=Archangium lansingense TaxID=2995310 RepID=A0ABT4A537_9BACT|nr:tetratricopeptide repeat protein [Archangium lansinium]MCY1076760.1 tetratricopeptide repeat protein [Archangium lansinium]
MTELEPLLNRIEQLTPYFGRAQDDLLALATRGRNRDYKGVLQNARLVLEMLLRSLVTTELKQTPGKAMLDELIARFRQQAHAGLVPTHILAHMGTVQAWGNLSSHDHAGDLHDAGVKVDLQEAVTSLNSLVAILTWYKERYVQESALAPVTEAPVTTVPVVRPPGGRRMALVGGAALVALASGLGVLAYRSDTGPTSSAPSLRDRVDALYATNAEPPPPADCQETDPQGLVMLLELGSKLSDRVPEKDRAREANAALPALRARGPHWGPEGWFYVARASLLAGNPDAEAMNKALLCTNFAAAENLAGRVGVATQNLQEAVVRLTRAAELDARFWKPRYNLGLIYLQLPRVDKAVLWLQRAAESAPQIAEIHFRLGEAYKARAAETSGQGQDAAADQELARAAFCRAKDLGHPDAAALCTTP